MNGLGKKIVRQNNITLVKPPKPRLRSRPVRYATYAAIRKADAGHFPSANNRIALATSSSALVESKSYVCTTRHCLSFNYD